MKLTKQKLEQLILETYKSYVRRPGDEGKPTNYPEYADKLTTLAKSDPKQAASLADSLGEPLDIEFDPSKMQHFVIDSEYWKHIQSPEFQLHYDFLMDDRASSRLEEPDIGEIYEFAQQRGLNPEDTRDKIIKSYRFFLLDKFTKNSKFKLADEEIRKRFREKK